MHTLQRLKGYDRDQNILCWKCGPCSVSFQVFIMCLLLAASSLTCRVPECLHGV